MPALSKHTHTHTYTHTHARTHAHIHTHTHTHTFTHTHTLTHTLSSYVRSKPLLNTEIAEGTNENFNRLVLASGARSFHFLPLSTRFLVVCTNHFFLMSSDGRPWCMVSPSCLESQGCHFLPLTDLVAPLFCTWPYRSLCLGIVLLTVHSFSRFCSWKLCSMFGGYFCFALYGSYCTSKGG